MTTCWERSPEGGHRLGAAMTADRDQAMERRPVAGAGRASDGRWEGIDDLDGRYVVRLRGSVQVKHTLARLGAERLRRCSMSAARGRAWPVHRRPSRAGGQAGLDAIYLSRWQVAADANLAEQVYPDRACTVHSVPAVAGGSTTPYGGPIRSPGPRGRTGRTGWPRSSPTPRRASAAP